MAENQEQLVFRCGWTWWRVLWLAFIYWPAFLIAMAPGIAVLSLVVLLIGTLFVVLDIWLTSRFIRNWRVELDFTSIRITDAEGKRVTILWEDIKGLTFFLFPDMRFRGGSITFPAGIIEGRRLFALIAERAGLTQRRRSWITGVRLTR